MGVESELDERDDERNQSVDEMTGNVDEMLREGNNNNMPKEEEA